MHTDKSTPKTCRICGHDRPRREFMNNPGARDGLDDRCRSCVRAQRHRKARASRRTKPPRQAHSRPHRVVLASMLAAPPSAHDEAPAFAQAAIDADGELALTDEHWAVLRDPSPSRRRAYLLRVLDDAGYEVVRRVDVVDSDTTI